MTNVEKYVNNYMWELMDSFRGLFSLDVSRMVTLEIVFLKLVKNNAKKDLFKVSKHNFFNELKDFLDESKEVQEVINDIFRLRDFDENIMAKTLDYVIKFNEDYPKEEEFRAGINFLFKNLKLNVNTTDNLNVLIREILKDVPFKNIYDPTVGTGMMVTEVCKYHEKAKIYGQDIDENSVKICKMLLIIEGHSRDSKNIYQGNTIINPKHSSKNKVEKFECIVSNHPFSQREWGCREVYEMDKFNRFYRGTPTKTNGDYAYITHIVESLNDYGTAVLLEPSGVLFREGIDGEIRRKLIEENLIHSVIALPNNMMYGTAIAVNLIIIKKNRKGEDILFIDVINNVKSSKKITILENDIIKKIVNTLNGFIEDTGFSKIINKNEVLRNSGSLSVRKYVETEKCIEYIDLESIKLEMKELKNELFKVQSELDEYLS